MLKRPRNFGRTKVWVRLEVKRPQSSVYRSFLAQLVERVTSNDEVSRSSRLEGIFVPLFNVIIRRFGEEEREEGQLR